MTKGIKFGLILEILTFLVMMGLVINGKPVPGFLMWGFYMGLLICLVTAFSSYKSKDNASNNRKTVLKGLTPAIIATVALIVLTYFTLH